jgi:hypothetical protein
MMSQIEMDQEDERIRQRNKDAWELSLRRMAGDFLVTGNTKKALELAFTANQVRFGKLKMPGAK